MGEYKLEQIDLKRAIIGLRHTHSKAWNKRTQNWVIVKHLVGCGMGASYKWCEKVGVDPDGYEIVYPF